jgi:aspartate 1-decarboxylase
MLIELLKSKIHQVSVTQADLYYVGSITIDADLMDAAQIVEYEKVSVVNINNGERFDTYVIKGGRGTGVIGVNGPAARRVCVGDVLVIMAYARMTPDEARSFKPCVVFPDKLTNLLPPK